MPIPSVLIIDDCDEYREVVCDLLLDAGYDVWDASCSHDAFSIVRREQFDLIICDLHMPFMNGSEGEDFQTSYQVGIGTIKELKGVFPNTLIIGLTSTDPSDLKRIRKSIGDIEVFTKPARNQELMAIVENLLDRDSPTLRH